MIAFVLALVRLVMQIPLSILPARIAADVQAQLRTKLFYAFTCASWELQSRDREGQLQDTMTSQTMQATGGALRATSLITSALNFFTLRRHRIRAQRRRRPPRSSSSACAARSSRCGR